MNPLCIDNSALRLVATCSTAADLRIVKGYTAPDTKGYRTQGSAGHEALASYLRTGNVDTALLDYQLVFREWSDTHLRPVERLWYGKPKLVPNNLRWENTSTILREWMVAHSSGTLPFAYRTEHIEVGFKLPLTPTLTLTGRMDLLAWDQAGRWCVVDHKFTGRLSPEWWHKWRLDSGLTGYCWAASQVLGVPVSTIYINGIETAELPSDPKRKCTTHGLTYADCGRMHATWGTQVYTRSPADIARWQQSAEVLAGDFAYHRTLPLERLSQEGMFNGSCSRCDFENFCAAGRPEHLLDTMLVHEPWEPLHAAGGMLE